MPVCAISLPDAEPGVPRVAADWHGSGEQGPTAERGAEALQFFPAFPISSVASLGLTCSLGLLCLGKLTAPA